MYRPSFIFRNFWDTSSGAEEQGLQFHKLRKMITQVVFVYEYMDEIKVILDTKIKQTFMFIALDGKTTGDF